MQHPLSIAPDSYGDCQLISQAPLKKKSLPALFTGSDYTDGINIKILFSSLALFA